MSWMDPKFLLIVGINLVGLGAAYGGLASRLRGLEKWVENLDRSLHNGLSEKVAGVEAKVDALQVRGNGHQPPGATCS